MLPVFKKSGQLSLTTYKSCVGALAAGALLLASTGCEKIVDLNLKTSTAQLVIEGNLVDDNQPCQVSISRSANYTDTNTFEAVRGATITLADNAGGLETLRETATPGRYLGATLRGVPGRTYTLRVETDGAAYVATSRLPAPVVPFEKLSTQLSAFGTDNIQAVVDYTDPAGKGNSYLFRQYRNGKLNNAIFVQNDEFTDGNRISQVLRTRSSSSTDPNELDKLKAGDSLRVEMQNIDPGVYEYFRTLTLILTAGGAPTTTPANPKSNFSGGALGYFSAHSRRVLTIKVP
ncbi:DUF4249 domain-containing protein [Hymenobacter setariae]|uniref:DUF4249 domain-containing protein n=1 Tax=Hymenobacter setariae TaxID=2594794 RepID=A0A558C2U7_9BACT|nr:DUF4249 domain-containing protein [Hymenobacter setariae]TVT43034.1 DUF4249 domain-containing protein [Hymenobacter setariae]